MSTRTKARQLAQHLLAEIEELLAELDALKRENVRLRALLADAIDANGVTITDEPAD